MSVTLRNLLLYSCVVHHCDLQQPRDGLQFNLTELSGIMYLLLTKVLEPEFYRGLTKIILPGINYVSYCPIRVSMHQVPLRVASHVQLAFLHLNYSRPLPTCRNV